MQTRDYQKEAEELRIIVDKASRVVPKYRQQNKRLCEIIKQNAELYQKDTDELQHTIDTLRLQSRQQESAHNQEVSLLKVQITALQHQSEKLQNDLQSEKTRLIRSRFACGILCAALAFSCYSLFTRPTVPVTQASPISTFRPTQTPVSRATSVGGSSSFSAFASNASNYTATYVWIPRSGERYHDKESCSGMINPSLVSLAEAKRLGFTPCGRCKPPR